MSNPKKPRTPCLNCGRISERWNYKFCSNQCQADHSYKEYIAGWKAGHQSGLLTTELVSRHIRRFLIERYGEKCSECGWNRRHLITRQVPLSIHHIDGDWMNNREENLTLLCPNCHALTANFQNLNRGNGRTYRRKYEQRKSSN